MTFETWVVVIFVGLAVLAGAIWSARQTDRRQARASNILSHGEEQQRAADELQRRSDELQRREAELLSRWEVVLTRIEAVAARWEAQGKSDPGADPRTS